MAPRAQIDVLLDMTPLDTSSRLRGIGRYLTGLTAGLRAMDDAARGGLRIEALTSTRPLRAAGLDPTLTFTGDPRVDPGALAQLEQRAAKRLWMGTAAHATGARLLHVTEPVATPLDTRTPRILTCYDLIPLVLADLYLSKLPGARAFWRLRERRRLGVARRVVAISETTKRDVATHLDIDPAIIDVTHLGVDHARFHPNAAPGEHEAVRALGVAGPFLLYAGAGDARKDLPRLVRAFAASKRSADVELVFVGSLSKARSAELAGIAEELGVGARVRLLGFVDDAVLPALYRACVANVFPSLYEGFGFPPLEALACGAPTVAAGGSWLSEVAGDVAVFYPSADTEGLAEAIRRVVDDADLRASFKERGPRRAAPFTWEACARATVASYRAALG